jgi:hypothetical protein
MEKKQGVTMTTEEKLLMMFNELEGPITGQCSAEVEYENGEPVGVNLMKDGHACWGKTKLELLFDYLTRDFS